VNCPRGLFPLDNGLTSPVPCPPCPRPSRLLGRQEAGWGPDRQKMRPQGARPASRLSQTEPHSGPRDVADRGEGPGVLGPFITWAPAPCSFGGSDEWLTFEGWGSRRGPETAAEDRRHHLSVCPSSVHLSVHLCPGCCYKENRREGWRITGTVLNVFSGHAPWTWPATGHNGRTQSG
jgi:hypothetical protein